MKKAKLVVPVELIGIELTAETEEEEAALLRFWNGGVKRNVLTMAGPKTRLAAYLR